MKCFTSSIIFLLLSFSIVFAQDGLRVGIVDAEMVLQKSAEGKAFFEEHQAFIKGKEADLNSLVEGFQEKQKDAQAKAASMSEDARREVALELERLQTDLKRKREDAEREVQARLNNFLDQFQRKLAPVIRQVAQEKGLDLVLNRGQDSNIVYYSNRIDITDAVVAKYDEAE